MKDKSEASKKLLMVLDGKSRLLIPNVTVYIYSTIFCRLVRPDVMVTAGHNVYDRDLHPKTNVQLGHCTNMKAWIGYQGRDSHNDKNVQFRSGHKVVTTSNWHDDRDSARYDVAFVKLNKPFSLTKLFKFAETPNHGSEKLGIVGYPADKTLGDENGAEMYEVRYHQLRFTRSSRFVVQKIPCS